MRLCSFPGGMCINQLAKMTDSVCVMPEISVYHWFRGHNRNKQPLRLSDFQRKKGEFWGKKQKKEEKKTAQSIA